jgi:hypothetical protein
MLLLACRLVRMLLQEVSAIACAGKSAQAGVQAEGCGVDIFPLVGER